MNRFIARYAVVALSVAGSAILLFSCDNAKEGDTEASKETMMTEYSENLSVVMSQNGRRSYHFKAPLVEGYSLAREPYREFRKGVEMTTYKDDSLSTVDVVLTADYAIHYENRELWEAKGNVVVEKSDGKTLYTQQLFWNARTKKIYSNVDSKIVQNGGSDVFIGEGFESDEEFKDWRFRRMKGRMEVEVGPASRADSGTVAQPAEPGVQPARGGQPVAGRPAAAYPARPSATVREEPPAVPVPSQPLAVQPETQAPEAQTQAPEAQQAQAREPDVPQPHRQTVRADFGHTEEQTK